MRTLSMLIFSAVLPLAGIAVAQAQQDTLVAKQTASAPATDGTLDAMCNGAPALTATVVGGKNFENGSTDVVMRSLYTSDMLYLMFQYKDPTESLRRSPWVKQADGSWKKLKDPEDKGGDNNLYYEDKFAMLWNISTPSFDQLGGLAVGRIGDSGKPYGNKYTENPGELLDMWHVKAVRGGVSIGQVDDQYVDSTRYSKDKSPNAGRKGDPKTGGGYYDNATEDKKGPKYGRAGNLSAPPYWILDSEKEPIDSAKYKVGDEVPGIIVAPFTGDRGDISATMKWENGVWTIVLWRKLVTGSTFDVQFDDTEKAYSFGVAVFNNAQVRHAFTPSVLKLKFE